MKKIIPLLTLMIAVFKVHAQNIKPCSSPESSQFDFWTGTWNLYSADTITGTNTIYKIMDGCTTQENFSDNSGSYIGKSWSVFNTQTKLWQQTWVDNQGSFIYLTGKFENGKMTLTTQPQKMADGKEQSFRMIYYNISADTFDWSWESTIDDGVTWKSNWQIHYVRKK